MLLLVAVASAIGAPVRYLVDQQIARRVGGGFPYGTLAVNVVGSLVLGLVAGLATAGHASADTMAFVGTGFCGALTTFSTFSYETIRLAEDGSWREAGSNIALSVAASLAAAAVGLGLGGL